MKKYFKSAAIIAILGTMIFVVTGCGSTSDTNSTSNPTTPTTQQQSDQTQSDTNTTPPVSGTPSTDNGTDATTASAGQTAFNENCAGCHSNVPRGTDVQQIEDIIKQGKGSMPAFESQLSDTQIQDIANYVVNGN